MNKKQSPRAGGLPPARPEELTINDGDLADVKPLAGFGMIPHAPGDHFDDPPDAPPRRQRRRPSKGDKRKTPPGHRRPRPSPDA